jgi:hypothetical protein
MMSQLDLIEDDGITNRFLEYFDENEKPDQFGRRSFFLMWDDKKAFAPGATRNPDGSVTRGQAFFAKPEEYIAEGYITRVHQWKTVNCQGKLDSSRVSS